MRAEEFHRRVARRAGVSERQARQVFRATVEETRAIIVDGEEVRLPGLGRFQVAWKWEKFRLRFWPYRSLQSFLDEEFVENRELEV